MTDDSKICVTAEIVDAESLLTIDDLCLACNVDVNWLVELVAHGVIEPIGQARADWKFTSLTIVRVAKARRLERDLSLNPPGVALVLDLLDEIDGLHAQLQSVRGHMTKHER